MNAIESLQMAITPEHECELTITVPRTLVGQEFADALNKAQQRAHRKGFRPGKMPKNMVLNFYGAEIKGKLIEKLIDKSFAPACKEKGLIPVSQPKMEPIGNIEQDKPFTYRAIFQVKPNVAMPEYKGLKVELRRFTFDESDVDDELIQLQEGMATFVTPSDRIEIKDNDLVQCDNAVIIDGTMSPEHSLEDYAVPLFAQNTPNDLKRALIGKKVSEMISVKSTLPHECEDGATNEKDCEMLLTVTSFKERILPKLDDDFAKDISDKFTCLEDVKESIRDRLATAAKKREEYYKQEAIIRALVEQNPLEVPPAIVERMALSLINRELEAIGAKTSDDFVKNHWQEIWESVQERALFRTKAQLLFEAMIRDLDINAHDEEIAEKILNIQDINKEDAAYFIQMEKLINMIEKESQISIIEEPLFKHEN